MQLTKTSKIILATLAALAVLAGAIWLSQSKTPEATNAPDQEAAQRQACLDKYQGLFKNADEVKDPLSYDKTNPELYKCLSQLKNPLGI